MVDSGRFSLPSKGRGGSKGFSRLADTGGGRSLLLNRPNFVPELRIAAVGRRGGGFSVPFSLNRIKIKGLG